MIRLAASGVAILLCVSNVPAHCRPEAERVVPPISFILFCARYPAECQSAEDRRISNVLSRGQRWRELSTINASVNLGIAPKASALGRRDYDWMISPYLGNCADYAVTKRHLLLRFGWPSASLLLAEVVLQATGEHHLVLLAKEAGEVFVLDNLDPLVTRLGDAAGRYVLVRIQSDADPRVWTRGPGAAQHAETVRPMLRSVHQRS